MKNIMITVIILIITLSSCKAQQIVDASTFNDGNNEGKYFKDLNNNFAPFLGTWEWQNGNQLFRITLWKEELVEYKNGNRPSFWMDQIKGHFEMVQLGQAGQQLETIIYTSNKPVGNNASYYPPVINASSVDGISCGGTILDNSDPNPSNYFGVRCKFSMNMVPNTSSGHAILTVESIGGEAYNIPNNITLTKVN